jgi:hypothetical protein
MLSKKLYESFGEVVKSNGFHLFTKGIEASFSTDEEFGYWVYSGGANLYSYINALNSKEVLEDLSLMITDIFKANFNKVDIESIKKDKSSFKFVIKWLAELGQTAEEASKIKHLSSSKRNLYCTFLCVLLNFSSIEDEDILTDDEIKEQEFEMINADDLDTEEVKEEKTQTIIESSENPTTENSELIEG